VLAGRAALDRGITAFGASALTVRTATRVKPGRHEAVAATLRLLLKQAVDREAGKPRSGLIPIVHYRADRRRAIS
jgi:hypothetical protein